MAIKKKEKSENKAIAFVNWEIPTKDGYIKSPKGFPLFQNPDYPNSKEDLLIELAKSKGGTITLNLRCTVVLNKDTPDIPLEDIILG